MKILSVVTVTTLLLLPFACNKSKFGRGDLSKNTENPIAMPLDPIPPPPASEAEAEAEAVVAAAPVITPLPEPAPPALPEPMPAVVPGPLETSVMGVDATVEAKLGELDVKVPAPVIKAGEMIQATAVFVGSTVKPDVVWSISGPAGRSDIGKIDQNGVYTSPATTDMQFSVVITATLKNDSTKSDSTTLQVVPVEQIFTTCSKGTTTFPIFVNVYSIPTTSTRIPDYNNPAEATKVTTVCMDNYAVEPRNFSEGFPNLEQFIEYFSLETTTTLVVPMDGEYIFQLNSDDGSRLLIDGKELINNDGIHQAIGPGPFELPDLGQKEGTITLKKGDHPLQLNYFQGPKFRIALVLKWKIPGALTFEYVPREAFK